MEVHELIANVREDSGKGHSRRLRQAGLIPAVFYGPGAKTISLNVNAAELMSLRKKEEKAFIKLIIDDQGKKVEKLSVLKELQIEPLSRRPVHADFYEITMDHKFTFDIPIHLSGKPKGVDEGGELHILKRELKVSCLPGMRQEFITLDISGLQIGGSLKVHDLATSEGVTIIDNADAVIATVSAMKESVPIPTEGEAAAEVSASSTPAK